MEPESNKTTSNIEDGISDWLWGSEENDTLIGEYNGNRKLGCINKKSCSGNGICDIDNKCLCATGIGLYCDYPIDVYYPQTVIDGNVDENCELEDIIIEDSEEEESEESEEESEDLFSTESETTITESSEEEIIILSCPADCND